MQAGVANPRGVPYLAFQQIHFVFAQVTIKHCLETGAGQVLQNIYSVAIALIQLRMYHFFLLGLLMAGAIEGLKL